MAKEREKTEQSVNCGCDAVMNDNTVDKEINPGNTIFKVLSPVGSRVPSLEPISARLDSLNGKTIGELSSNVYNENLFFPVVREMLKQRYPDIRIITYDEINKEIPRSTVLVLDGKISVQKEREQAAIDVAHQKGCDAVIVGNGG